MTKGFSLVALHVNHGLRGAESDEDEAFCVSLCRGLGVPIEVHRADVRTFAKRHSLSLEDAARRCRFEWFVKAGVRHDAAAVFLAHHADDQAETVLLRLFRGAGLRGLAGMKHVAQFRSLAIVRPWLDIRQRVLDAYRTAHGLPCRIDSSNTDRHFERNWVRHVVLPGIEQRHGDQVAERIVHAAHVCREVEEYVMAHAAGECDTHGTTSRLGMSFPVERFARLHVALQRAVVRHMFDVLHGDDRQHIEFAAIEAVRALGAGDSRMLARPLPRPLCAFTAYGRVFIGRVTTHSFTQRRVVADTECPLGNGVVVRIERVARRGRGVSDNGEAWEQAATGARAPMVQYACLPAKAKLVARPRTPGDRYCPVHGFERKVKELLIEAGVPQQLKEAVPLLLLGDRPVWIAGWRIADEFKAVRGRPVWRVSCVA